MATDLYYPDGIQALAPVDFWMSSAPGYGRKAVIHTTEGPLGVYTYDRNGYYGNSWSVAPNATLAVYRGDWRVYEHKPHRYCSGSLLNKSGGVETNRGNAIQIEIATKAKDVRNLPDVALDELAAYLSWLSEVSSLKLVSYVDWKPYPSSYGLKASQRLSPLEWKTYEGILGHQHVPENDHGDPGDFPYHKLAERFKTMAAPAPTTGEIIGALKAAMLMSMFAEGDVKADDPFKVLARTYFKAGDLQTSIARVIEGLALTGAGVAFDRAEQAELKEDVTRLEDKVDKLTELVHQALNMEE